MFNTVQELVDHVITDFKLLEAEPQRLQETIERYEALAETCGGQIILNSDDIDNRLETDKQNAITEILLVLDKINSAQDMPRLAEAIKTLKLIN